MASASNLRGAITIAGISVLLAGAFLACGGGSDEGGSGSGSSQVVGSEYTPVEAAAQPPIPPGAGPAPPGPDEPPPTDAKAPDAVADAPIVDATGQ
ncbi:MAG TPA: hypothetical protein VLT33_40765 [Labilithrix sp.]|nr:hypothetical protein [Labilithrix sp.]